MGRRPSTAKIFSLKRSLYYLYNTTVETTVKRPLLESPGSGPRGPMVLHFLSVVQDGTSQIPYLEGRILSFVEGAPGNLEGGARPLISRSFNRRTFPGGRDPNRTGPIETRFSAVTS